MNHSTVTLVTDLPPSVGLADNGRIALRFGADDTFTVILSASMTSGQRTAWCRGLARQLTAVAADAEVQATVTA
jgi:hypothetical protein